MDDGTFIPGSAGAVTMGALEADRARSNLASKSVTALDPISASATANLDRFMKDYGAVWNESNPTERRRRIGSVWTEDGINCHKTLLARGYEEIEKRVTDTWEKYMRDGKYIFKSDKTACHHDVIRDEFLLLSIPDGKVEARGLSFLILDGNNRIHLDLQFNPAVDEAGEFVDRYLAVLNEEAEDVQRNRLIELWAPDATYVGEQSAQYGHTDLLTRVRDLQRANARADLAFVSAKASNAHHNFVTFRWQIENRHSRALAGAGSELVVLDESGRIKIDYQFSERT